MSTYVITFAFLSLAVVTGEVSRNGSSNFFTIVKHFHNGRKDIPFEPITHFVVFSSRHSRQPARCAQAVGILSFQNVLCLSKIVFLRAASYKLICSLLLKRRHVPARLASLRWMSQSSILSSIYLLFVAVLNTLHPASAPYVEIVAVV